MGELRESERARCLDTFNTCGELRANFPLTLSNGARVPTPTGVCSGCKSVIEDAMVHGRVYWPLPTVAVIEGAGLCVQCQRMTQLYLRVRPAGRTYSAETPRIRGRGWEYVEAPDRTWWTDLWRRIRRLDR